MARLDGKVAIVTGAAGGIGLGIATRFREEGAKVVATDINPKGGNAVAEIGAEFFHHDVADEDQWKKIVKSVFEKHGRIDILANNAGVGADVAHGDPEDAKLADWRKLFSVNTEGMFLGCKVAIPLMATSGGGSIVNTASLLGILPSPPGFFAYGASKAAVLHMTRSVALYCARKSYAIRCNSISPGQCVTPGLEAQWSQYAAQSGRPREEVVNDSLKLIPLGKFQHPVDLANAALFLASDEGRYVTGINIVVDGGIQLAL